MNKAWENIEKAREVWPPNILKMLEYYDKAIEERHDYALTYKDRARLFFVLGDMQKSEENYQLWRKVEEENGQRGNSDKKLIKMVDDSITNELRIRKKGSFHKIHPWEKLKEYYESHPGPEILKEPNNEINSEKEMVRKKDTLIEEAKKIKEELNEIKSRKKEIEKTFRKKNTKPAKKIGKKISKPIKKIAQHSKKTTITKTRKTFVMNLPMYKIVKENVANSIMENSTSSSDSQIINCMILHSFKNNFRIDNINSILNEFNELYKKEPTSRKTITLDKTLHSEILKITVESLKMTGTKISDSKLLNLLIYYASKNNFNHTLVLEYVSDLKSESKTKINLENKIVKEKMVRCKICNIEFRLPTKKELEYQMCNICGKKSHPTKTQVKINSKVEITHIDFQNKQTPIIGRVQQILTPGDWHYNGLMVYLDNGYQGRVKKVISENMDESEVEHSENYARVIEYGPEKSIKNSKNDEIAKLEEKQKDLNDRKVQIDFEMGDLKRKEQKIRQEIDLEESQQKERQGKGISKIFGKFSNKNKPLEEYSKKFFQEKNYEITLINLEVEKKLEEQKKIFLISVSLEKEIERIRDKDKEIQNLEEKIRQENKIEQEISNNKELDNEIYEKIPEYVYLGLIKKGKTISEIFKNNEPDPSNFEEEKFKDLPIWHSKKEVDKFVQEKLKLSVEHIEKMKYSDGRNKFYYKIVQKISDLRKNGDIVDWVDIDKNRTGVWRLSNSNIHLNKTNYGIKDSHKGNFDQESKILEELEKESENNEISHNEIKKNKNSNFEEINNLTSQSLGIIEKRPNGVLESEIKKILSISDEKWTIIIPKLLNIESITNEPIKREGILVNRIFKTTVKKSQNEPKNINNENNLEGINQLISKALVLIRKNVPGVDTSALSGELDISKKELEQLVPRLLRIEGIVKEDEKVGGISRIILRSISESSNETSDVEKIRNEIKEIEHEARNRIEKQNKQKNVSKIKQNKESKQDKEIKDITEKMVVEHIRWKTNIHKKLKIELIDFYLKHKSMKKVYNEFSIHTKQKIRLHLVTNIRLPPKLKVIESSGGLHSDPTCSIVIALYATDYYDWDGGNNDEAKVIELAKSISKYLQIHTNLNHAFEGKR